MKILLSEGLYHNDYTAGIYNNLGSLYRQNGEFEEVLNHFRESLNISLELYGSEHPILANTFNNIGFALLNQDKWADGKDYLEKALHLTVKFYGGTNRLTANI
ncbi:MAG: tetratricopeptide repeat protein [Cytophagales bacterium]|nr:tetratricopeptide repeat protein [Cytophagales bacterium]